MNEISYLSSVIKELGIPTRSLSGSILLGDVYRDSYERLLLCNFCVYNADQESRLEKHAVAIMSVWV